MIAKEHTHIKQLHNIFLVYVTVIFWLRLGAGRWMLMGRWEVRAMSPFGVMWCCIRFRYR